MSEKSQNETTRWPICSAVNNMNNRLKDGEGTALDHSVRLLTHMVWPSIAQKACDLKDEYIKPRDQRAREQYKTPQQIAELEADEKMAAAIKLQKAVKY